MRLWFIREDGRALSLWDPYSPTLYIRSTISTLSSIFRRPPLKRIPVTIAPVERVDLLSGKTIPVLEVQVKSPSSYHEVVSSLDLISRGRLDLYTCDISLSQRYLWDKGIFPLALCAFESDPSGNLLSLENLDDPWSIDYRIPPLNTMEIKLEGDLINPGHGYSGRLEVIHEGRSRIIDGESPESFLETFARILMEIDPDVIISYWGDSWHMPVLRYMQRRCNIPLPLHRDPKRPGLGRKGKTYISYGRIVHREGSSFLGGRWHLDVQNSFIIKESGLEGLIELTRLSCIPAQPLARSSTGTVITAMQLHQAYREGVLIPYRKQEPEGFKSAEDLITADKGGLVFLPEPGVYGDVAELDFASLYPTIMAKYNISQETLDCPCCLDHTVPEIGRHTCTRREGLIPRVLKPILQKRAYYKAHVRDDHVSREDRVRYKERQNALKWILVTCFGYLGYRNARFGRIDAHEAVTAWGRELLLQAKEIAEGEGYRIVHAIVDSLWVHKAGITEGDAEGLSKRITEKTGISMTLEGIYRWLIFPPSRMRPSLAVPNRYVGVFRNGEIKVRGIEMRRRDTPPFIAEAQEEIIQALSCARSPADLPVYAERTLEVLERYAFQLMEGKVSPMDLAITKRMTRRPEDYSHAVDTAIASRSLRCRGIRLEPGEEIQIIITSARDKDPDSRVKPLTLTMDDRGYDREKYLGLLIRAAETILKPLGCDVSRDLFRRIGGDFDTHSFR